MTESPGFLGFPGLPERAGLAASCLSAQRRTQELHALPSADLDVLVVGGGITGVGVALDAASRGLSVALVEAQDLAFGTSRWSSKLIHGGLRYLASGDVAIAYESARERAALMHTIAPHLARPLPFLVPYNAATTRKDRLLVAAGTRTAEALQLAARTHPGTLARPRRVGAAEARSWAPAVRDDVTGGTLFWDGQLEDDARLVVAVARTAAAHGARILTRVRAISLSGDSAQLRDELTGAELSVRAKAVVNATGVWAGELAGTNVDGTPVAPLRPSKGTHIVLRSATLGEPAAAMMMAIPGESSRFVFALPHPDGIVIVGLTDDPVSAVTDVPLPAPAEIDFLLGTLSHWLAKPVTAADVVGSFSGLRPLVAAREEDQTKRTADLSRRHLVARSTSGVVTVVGGKLTTYRRMAEDTVSFLGLTDAPCRTRSLPLVGAAPRGSFGEVDAPGRLIRRYGTEADLVASLAAEDPRLAAPLAPGIRVLGTEVLWALQAEGAMSVEDILERRTRLALVPADAQAAREAVTALVERYGPASVAGLAPIGAS
jgi:glycerol-3-phosphate dehydrogenase